MKKHHIIYKITNMLDGKFYIGKHSTDSIEDGYMGSGLHLRSAIEKHGVENFTREILFVFDNPLDMNVKEKELVNESLVLDIKSYNIALGGQGGNLGSKVNKKIGQRMSEVLTGKSKTHAHKQAISEAKKDCKRDENTKTQISISVKKTWDSMTSQEREQKCGREGKMNSFYGKTHSVESLNKMKATIGDSRKGSKNANAKPITVYGTTYQTRKECLEALGISKRKLYKILGEV